VANILDNVCIESLSIDLTRPMLDAAARSVDKLADKIDEQVIFELSIRGQVMLIELQDQEDRRVQATG
jgi:hypothetical protein